MTPRAKFRANRAFTRGYNDLILGDQLQAALDAATLQLNASFPWATDPQQAAANRYRLEGAIMLRTILENLNTSDTPIAPDKTTSNLSHED